MNKSTDQVQVEEKKFEFRLAFLQNETFGCFKKAEQNKNYEPCKAHAKSSLQRYLDEFIAAVKQ